MNSTVDLSADASMAVSNITANVYSGFNIVSTVPIVLGAVFILALVAAVVFMPRHVKRLIYGYCGILLISCVWALAYGFFKSLGSIAQVGVSFLTALGEFILSYWTVLLLSLPVAYLVGCKLEDKVDVELSKQNEVKEDE